MTRPRRPRQAPVQRNFDSLKRFYGVPPLSACRRRAFAPYYTGAYSRRDALSCQHIVGAPREQLVARAMRTFVPSVCTQEVMALYLQVAALVSVYYDTVDQLARLPPA